VWGLRNSWLAMSPLLNPAETKVTWHSPVLDQLPQTHTSSVITRAAAVLTRSDRHPEAVSVHNHRHPAALRASCSNAGSPTVVDTLAYPSSSPRRRTVPDPPTYPTVTHR